MSDVHGTQAMELDESAGRTVRVWDPLVRVFHWSLVAAFAVAWTTADEVQPVHELAGYAVAGLLAFRMVWGFVGSRFARFSSFLYSPREAWNYLRGVTRVSSPATTPASRSSWPGRPRRSATSATL